MSEPILEVKHLKTYFFNGNSVLRASDDLSYTVHKGECVAIVGESGSGKSVSALSVLRLIPYPPGLIMDGEILFHGQNLLALSDAEIQELRGSKISMIFQEPSTALNPVVTIGNQICESLMIHRKMKKKEAMAEAV
jgi:ABC-type dipeptide/oligopeptide/nickel transport system ATPase component